MRAIYILAFECLTYLLFVGCLWHAARRGRFSVYELLWAGVYGFLLEWLTIKQLQAYQYGDFLIKIDGAPPSIALGWAVIIYSSMEFSNRIQLSEPTRPILDALLALNVDLTMDAIAIRVGLWVWHGVGLDQQWFGVPWANFGAWFIVVWSYSGCLRALRPWQSHRVRRWLYAPLALLLSLLALTATSGVYSLVAATTGSDALPALLLIVGSLLIILDSRPRLDYVGLPDPIIVAVPLGFHVFVIFAGIATGIFAKQPVLALIALLMLILSIGIHLLPWWIGQRRLNAANTQ
jgi:hypothetical protein